LLEISMIHSRALCLTLALFSSAAVAFSSEWPAFRGPVPGNLTAESLPVSWTPTEHIRWTAPIPGTGQSSPIVWQNYVYTTSVEGPNKEECNVLAYDLTTGEKRWQHTLANAFPVESTNLVSKAAPTAVTSEQGVIALFEGGNVVALDHDGTLLWERNLVEEYGSVESRHGLSSSLLLGAGNLVIWIERQDDPYILAVNPKTGENVWKIEGLGVTSWSSPIVLKVGGEDHFVFSGTGMIRGIHPASGESLWKVEGLTGNATPSPSAVGDGLMLIGATEARGESGGGKPADSNALIRVSKQDDQFQADFVWKAKRATSSFGSPVAHQGYAYFINRTGVLFCLDLETGEEMYAERLGEGCWATPLCVEDRIYFVGQRGTTTVVKAGREFEQLSQNRLWENDPDAGPATMGEGAIQYAVAAVPGALLIRTGEHIFCLEN